MPLHSGLAGLAHYGQWNPHSDVDALRPRANSRGRDQHRAVPGPIARHQDWAFQAQPAVALLHAGPTASAVGAGQLNYERRQVLKGKEHRVSAGQHRQ